MDTLKLGQIITDAQQKDAVHIAVAPVNAAETLNPGDHVGVRDGKAYEKSKHIGVVDPFLKRPVVIGETFWLFLYPSTVTGLRHEWQHPAFPEPDQDDDDYACGC